MSGELRAATATGATVYANILNSSSRRWNGSSFEIYASSSYSNYLITMTEQGTSGVYVGDFPISIIDSGQYQIISYIQDGGSPAEGDPIVGTASVNWTGSSVAEDEDISSGEMSGSDWEEYVLRTFKRTDKSDELFDATNAGIAEIRRKFTTSRDEKETSMTDTISTLGDYRLDVETDLGLMVSDVFIRDSSDGTHLKPISKQEYDRRYGIWGTASSERSRPCHYCLFGGQILLGPVPDRTSYTYVMTYGRANLAPVTSASTSIPYTTEDYKEILRDGVLWRLYKLVENDTQASAYRTLWLDGLVEIETKERRNRRAMMVVAYSDV